MSSKAVRVVARFTARPEKVIDLASVLRSLIGPTRKEAGCVSYELLRNNSDNRDFVFVEEWSSDSALDAHLSMPHVKDVLTKVTPLLAKNPEISRYSPVG